MIKKTFGVLVFVFLLVGLYFSFETTEAAFYGEFGNGTMPSDTVYIRFPTWDTMGYTADVDTYFVRRYYHGTLIDSTFGTAATNRTRTGYYVVKKRAISGTSYGQYNVEIEWHKDTKVFKSAGSYLVKLGDVQNYKTGFSLSSTQTFNNTGTWTGSLTGNVGGNVTGSIGSLATQAKADVEAECGDALTSYDPPTRTEATSDKNEILTETGNLDGWNPADLQEFVVEPNKGDSIVHIYCHENGSDDSSGLTRQAAVKSIKVAETKMTGGNMYVVHFGSGDFNSRNTIWDTPNLKLIGEGRELTTISTDSNSHTMTFDGSHSLYIEGIKFKGYFDAGTNVAVRLLDVDNFRITNCWFDSCERAVQMGGFISDGDPKTDKATFGEIDHCNIWHSNWDGLRVQCGINIWLHDNVVDSLDYSGADAIIVNSASDSKPDSTTVGVVVSNNIIYTSQGNGINLSSADNEAVGTFVVGNMVHTTDPAKAFPYWGKNSKFIDNHIVSQITAGDTGTVEGDMVKIYAQTDTTLDFLRDGVLYLYVDSASGAETNTGTNWDDAVPRIAKAESLCTGASAYEIIIGSGTYTDNCSISVSNLSIRPAQNARVLVSGSGYPAAFAIGLTTPVENVTITGLNITNNISYAGVRLDSASYCNIDNNYIYKISKGIECWHPCSLNTFSNNLIREADFDGIHLVGCSKNQIIGNTIDSLSNGIADGIALAESGSNYSRFNLIMNNTIRITNASPSAGGIGFSTNSHPNLVVNNNSYAVSFEKDYDQADMANQAYMNNHQCPRDTSKSTIERHLSHEVNVSDTDTSGYVNYVGNVNDKTGYVATFAGDSLSTLMTFAKSVAYMRGACDDTCKGIFYPLGQANKDSGVVFNKSNERVAKVIYGKQVPAAFDTVYFYNVEGQ